MRKQKQQKLRKRIAFFFLISIVFQVIYPTAAFALTTGPSQPEVQSFEPIEANNMVNMFSGDFTYNLPLLTVPGPNGGYPVNLSYHAGATMEEEASWVGLGWNINPGVISRNMRGIPDDFNGENVTKEISQKVHRTFSIGGGQGSVEVAGVGVTPSLGRIISYDNYKGLSLGANANFAAGPVSLTFNFDPETGIGLNPSLGIGDKNKINIGANYNSRQGLTTIGLSVSRSRNGFTGLNGNMGAGTRFGSVSQVPHQNIKYSGLDQHFLGKIGAEEPTFTFPNVYGEVGYKEKRIQSTVISSPAFGYLNSQNKTSDVGLCDFNKDNNGPISYDAAAIELPIATYDVYQATGQGISGVFRAQRNDLGIFTDPSIESNFDDKSLGGELGIAIAGGAQYLLPDLHIGVQGGVTYSQTYSGKWRDFGEGLTNYLGFSGTVDNVNSNGVSIVDSKRPTVYFKNAGETVANNSWDNEISRLGGAAPIAFDFSMELGDLLAFESKAKSAKWGESGDAFSYVKKRESDRRSTNFHYRLLSEIGNDATDNSGKYIFDYNSFPSTSNTGYSIYDNLPTGSRGNHIGEISVYKEDGMKYIYGLPVYNTIQNEVVFNLIDPNTQAAPSTVTANGTNYAKWAQYSSGDDGSNNNKGADNFYSSNNIPAYAHSYMLTAIYSPDYIDLTGNGPTEDDFGYYVKFNYSKSSDYKWRTPIAGANWDKGYYSNAIDDRGSYMYGAKEIYYLNSIETKSHIAQFNLGNRDDSHEAVARSVSAAPYVSSSDTKTKKLESIVLKSKNDIGNPIKTVLFSYDYSLCKNVPNNIYSSFGSSPDINKSGKLTLKTVQFTFQNNSKGLLTPYTFNYSSVNPDYDPTNIDRWGNYKNYTESFYSDATKKENNPYVAQGVDNAANNDNYANAWNLTQINMPSGASINVNYESDDYAYVQDKRAMQMFVIDHTGNSTSNSAGQESMKTGSDRFDRIYFKLNTPLANDGNLQTKLNEYINGVDNVFFKAFVSLKRLPSAITKAEDYVEGYCKIRDEESQKIYADQSTMVGNNYTMAYIRVKFVKTSKTDDEDGKLHPFRKAAFEYMKLNRPDLFFPNNFISQQNSALTNATNIGIQSIMSVVNFFTSVEELFIGYYNACRINGYAEKMSLASNEANYRPSFIRLNNPDHKKDGGGHRVKSIVINDNWNTMLSSQKSYQYGQEFYYVLPDGTSSGVAEYEPLLGGEEIPHHQPSDRFAAERKIINKQKEFYSEEPYGEMLFPAANVGYSRVVVKNIDPPDPYGTGTADNSESKNGISVHEFYTAKDFPIITSNTEANKGKHNISINIPFIGSKSSSVDGHSQGFTVELNDMHGKPKSNATYSYTAFNNLIGGSGATNPNPPYKTNTSYIYNTVSAYNPNLPNKVKSLVPVIENDGATVNKEMGVTYDFNTYMNENSDFSLYAGADFNFDMNWFVIPVPSPGIPGALWEVNPTVLSIQMTENQTRTISTTKTIVRNGILMETRQFVDGSQVINKILAFDGESGIPVLTTTINEFDKPVYNYDYKAHWFYNDMKNNGTRYRNSMDNLKLAYSTVANSYDITSSTSGVDFTQTFKAGDLLYLRQSDYTQPFYGRILSITSSNMTVIPESIKFAPSSISTSTAVSWHAEVIKPIESNQQSVNSGFITSLTNPTIDNRKVPFWNSLNDYLASQPSVVTSTSFTYNFLDSCNVSFEGVVPSKIITGILNMASPNHLKLQVPIAAGGFGEVDINTTPSSFPFITSTTYNINDYRFYYVDQNHVQVKNIVSGASTIASLIVKEGVEITSCIMNGVLRAGANTFDNDFVYDYADVGNPNSVLINTTSPSLAQISANIDNNPYKLGKKGIWKTVNSYEYLAPRNQLTPQTNIAKDGEITGFTPFVWNQGASLSSAKWNLVNKVTKYNPYGFEIENQDILGKYSNALYGYNNQLAVSVANNAGYYETAFDGFEDYPLTSMPNSYKSGHFNWSYQSAAAISLSNKAHTGIKSIEITASNPLKASFSSSYGMQFIAGSKYTMTFWIKEKNSIGTTSNTNDYAIKNSNITSLLSATNLTLSNINISNYQIEGWRRVEAEFVANSTAGTITLSPSVDIYMDDIRIQPFECSQKTYVYDRNKLWLVAELDERNFATFYNYDEEGTLIQVKKETTSGIVTLKTNRQNIKQ